MTTTSEQEVGVRVRRRTPFTLREQVLLAMLGSSIVLAKFAVRMPLHIPGRSGIFWIPFFVIGKGLVRKPGSGLTMGLIAGVLAMVAVPSNEGMLVWIKYAAAGLTLDIVTPLLGGRLDNIALGAIAGTLAHLAKSASVVAISIVMGIPATSVAVGLGVTTTTHVIFGAIGGAIGALALTRMEKLNLWARDAGAASEE